MRMHHIFICGLSGYTIFFSHIISYTEWVSKKKLLDIKSVILFLYNVLSETFLFLREEMRTIRSKEHVGLQVTYPIFLLDFNKIWIFWTDFRKIVKYRIS